MKKFGLLLLVFVFLTPWTAWSTPIDDLYITLSNDYNGDGDSVTGLFDEMDFYDESRSTYSVKEGEPIVPGVTFTDEGHAIVTEFKRFGHTVTDTEDIRTSKIDAHSWELTIVWEMVGEVSYVTSSEIGGVYKSGDVYVYIDETPDAYFGSTADIDDDDENTFTTGPDEDNPDGALLLHGIVVDGDGSFKDFFTSDNFNRTVNVTLLIKEINTDYIQSDTIDLGQLVSMEWMLALATEGNNGNTQIGYDDDGSLFAYGQGTGTIKFTAVPEPATILLLGGGLFVIGVMGRKKIIK